MSKICDLYICEAINVSAFKFIRVFDKDFNYEPEKLYVGYLGVNIVRVKMVSIIVDLKKHGVKAFSVPIRYRQERNLPFDEALLKASQYAEKNGYEVVFDSLRAASTSPVFWLFNIAGDLQERSGGMVLVDRIDGHIWQTEEYDEYMYDYNNIL